MRAATGTAVLVLLLASAACGKKGPPEPPLPRGPLVPEKVVARQMGQSAIVFFGVPRPRGPKPSQEPVRAELLRVSFPPGTQPGSDPDAFRRRGEVVGSLEGVPLTAGARMSIEDRTWGRLSGALGFTLRYAVRLRDLKNRPSVLGVAPDLVPLASQGAVAGLEAEPTADGVRLRWEALPGESGVGYNVYRSAPGAPTSESPLNPEPLRATEYLDAEVVPGNPYVYEVRVALAAGPPPREGLAGKPREIVAEDRFAPAAPTGLVGVQEGLAVRLFWNPGRERDLAGYRLQRSKDAGEWAEAHPGLLEQPSWLDAPVQVGERMGYRVASVDRASNQSAWSSPVDVVISAEPAIQDRGGE